MHVHTHYSHCSNNKPADILKRAKKKGLSGIAITDHHAIKGALEVKKLNKDKNFEVVVGEEVQTELGHILIYFLKKKIKKGTFNEVLKQAKKQKAICALAHPFNYPHPLNKISGFVGKIVGAENSIKSVKLNKKNIEMMKKLDAIEGINSRRASDQENIDAVKLAKKLNMSLIAGSDAHFSGELGKAYVEIEKDISLKQAIKSRKSKIKGKRNSLLLTKIKIALNLFRKIIRKAPKQKK